MGIFQCHLSFQGCTLFQPVDNRYCQGDEMLKNFAAEPHLDKENKARFLWPQKTEKNAGPCFFFCVFRMSKLPKEHNFSGAFLGSVALFFCFTHTSTTWKGSMASHSHWLIMAPYQATFWEWLAIYFQYRVRTAFRKIEVIECRLSHC